MINPKKLTKATTPKFTEGDFQRLKALAQCDGKSLGEWARDRLLEIVHTAPPASATDHAILAEIVATQDILVGLLCALGSDGKLTAQRAQAIVDEAHNRKYRDVPALFKYATSRSETRGSAR